ncbi:MAG: arginine--tRNA ligase [Candidatus Nomurabacteria bacterium]|nr:arginine--tRNA ligase [Candidatus Nomurabacteria bacterium]
MKQKIINLIKDALNKLEIGEVNFVVEHPEDFKNGDYSTNVAMVCAKQLKMNPRELAEKISAEIMKHPLRLSVTSPLAKGEGWGGGVEKIEVAGAGFINFYISKEYFQKELANIITLADKYGSSDLNKGKKILVEHSSPNLFKPFHVGHMMNNAIGESITRLAHFSGAEVKAISFPSDISLGVAKAIFIILEKQIDGQVFKPVDIVVLGDAYVEGTKRYDDDESKKTLQNSALLSLVKNSIWNILKILQNVSVQNLMDIFTRVRLVS